MQSTFAVWFLLSASAFAQQGNISLASCDSAGNPAALDSSTPHLSADGSTVAFVTASALDALDTNGVADVYVRDLRTGQVEWISVGLGATPSSDKSQEPALSADGRFVAFASYANNLVAGDAALVDVFVRDRSNGVTQRVSVSSAGVPANTHSFAPDISQDGRFVVFHSLAPNLAAGDNNGLTDVFVHDRQTGVTDAVSRTPTGATGNSTSQSPRISADGRYVAFLSVASNLVANDLNGTFDIFRRDRLLGVTEIASVSTTGQQAATGAYYCSISGDGRFIGFASSSNELTPVGFIGTQTFVRDMQLATTELACLGLGGASPQGGSHWLSFSFDGRFVAVQSWAGNLTAGDLPGDSDIFLRDRLLGTTREVTIQRSGAQSTAFYSILPSLNGDGSRIAFVSYANDFGPFTSNLVQHVFLWDGNVSAPLSYCTAGTSANGCVAKVHVDSNPSVTFDRPCRIVVAGVDPLRSGLCFYGLPNPTFVPSSWSGGSSYLCVPMPLQRTAAHSSGGGASSCDGTLHLDWNPYQLSHPSALGAPWSAGDRVLVQAWWRDAASPGSATFSDAVELTYLP